MDPWTFMDFISDRGENLIRSWLDGLPEVVQAKIDDRLKTLRAMPIFPPQYISNYKGHDKILELRVSHCGVQYRPLGCHGPGRGEFTFLIGAIEKGGKIPKGTLESAERRRAQILSDKRYVDGHKYDDA